MSANQPPIMAWDDWPKHPTWQTERQHVQAGLVPGGEPVARVWYSNKYMKRRGQEPIWLLLFDTVNAQPKVISEEKQAAVEKAKETARLNRICPVCGKERDYKITEGKHGVKMCIPCQDDTDEIERARGWLSGDYVILDTETSGLGGSAEILSISVIDMQGNILLNTYIKPRKPIDESLTEIGMDWYGNDVEKPTAFAINGIGNETVKDAPDFPTVWATLQPILEGKTILCYNEAFDMGMLEGDIACHHLDLPAFDADCVMEWYAMYHGEYDERHDSYRWVKLRYAAEQQGAVVENAHEAHGDCLTTLALIKAIAAKPTPLERVYQNKDKQETSVQP